ncbi:MAG: glycosyltransferase family 2 protein [Elusimicrobiota bacterium]|nr:glycosyltransferase family 2 protein [Elusimicrobiota bacterium]
MRVSIITVALNAKATIEDTITSVLGQGYKDIEYIIIDGGSTDGTLEVINKYKNRISKVVSEPDNGMYDAINKGVRIATGEIVGLLHADDLYVDKDVVGAIVEEFKPGVDSVYADLVYVERENIEKVVRYYDSSAFNVSKFAYGWMPAHPACFFRKSVYDKHGLYKNDYLIAADYELLVRFYAKFKITHRYLHKVIVKMRSGGVSTKNFKSNITLNREIVRACRENGVETNIFKVYLKYFSKFLQLFQRPG